MNSENKENFYQLLKRKPSVCSTSLHFSKLITDVDLFFPETPVLHWFQWNISAGNFRGQRPGTSALRMLLRLTAVSATRFFWTFAPLSPHLALLVNNLERLWEELFDSVFYTEIWSANGNIMLYLSNGSRDQKQAKVLLLPKSLSKMVWWTRDHVKSVSCLGDVENVESLGYRESRTFRSSCCFRSSDDNQVTFPLFISSYVISKY